MARSRMSRRRSNKMTRKMKMAKRASKTIRRGRKGSRRC